MIVVTVLTASFPTVMASTLTNTKGKIHKIVVKDEDGNVLGTFDEDSFPNGKPSVEIYYY